MDSYTSFISGQSTGDAALWILRKAAFQALILFLCDGAIQLSSNTSYLTERGMSAFLAGACLGPLLGAYFPFLGYLLAGGGLEDTALKVVIDLIFLIVLVPYVTFFVSESIRAGTVDITRHHARALLSLSPCLVFAPVFAFGHHFVPPQWIHLYVNILHFAAVVGFLSVECIKDRAAPLVTKWWTERNVANGAETKRKRRRESGRQAAEPGHEAAQSGREDAEPGREDAQSGRGRGKEKEDEDVHNEDEWEERNCVICFQRKRNMIIEPCCHLCLCPTCCEGVKTCPVCRADAKEIKRVFE